MSERAREGEATGKVVLFGEHAVVHGVGALAAPVPGRRTRVVARAIAESAAPGGSPRVDHGPAVRVACARGLDTALAQRMAERALDLARAGALEQAGPPEALDALDALDVRIDSDLPLGGGLGSSAALAVALVRALAPGSLPADEVARRAHELERLAHGTPSGMDTAAIALGRPIWFRRGEPPEPLALGAPLRLVVAVLPREGSTAGLVASVRALAEHGDPRFEAFLAASRRVVGEARAALAALDGSAEGLAPLGALVREAHAALAAVGVSSPAQDALVAALERAGALGAKLSGAGGGGATIALAPAGLDERGVRALLEAARAGGAIDAFVTTVPPSAVPASTARPTIAAPRP